MINLGYHEVNYMAIRMARNLWLLLLLSSDWRSNKLHLCLCVCVSAIRQQLLRQLHACMLVQVSPEQDFILQSSTAVKSE